MSKKKSRIKFLSLLTLVCMMVTGVIGFTPYPVQARDSTFTQKGVGPMYWIAYEQCIETNQISQDRFLANVDWVSNNFEKYGYNMVSTDGWIESSTRTNSNGYVISYNDNWTMTWQDLKNYCSNKNLNLGVYYNPLWVTPAAVADSTKTVVGTNIKVTDIVDKTYVYDGYNPANLTGDRFGYTFNNGDKTLYWVDVTKPGAKEYIQGYVNYFKNMGVKYLRVDFLSWYEDGMDKGNKVGKNHGTANYDLALSWMKEAAGSDMELSLVMPHLYNNGATEIKYGDMCRINEDCGDGSWYRFSDMDRGVKYPGWSVYHNPFDGLIYWSQYFAKGKMLPDADMLRIHKMSNDSERMSAVSLCAIAGAPINIADQYDTIGGSAWVYQNSEITELNRMGFVGKPLSYDPTNVDSSTWVGQMPNGDWIVGLFNRESTNQSRSINFSLLGINGSVGVRDLWSHNEVGNMSSYNATLLPHSCKIIRVKNPKQRIEAEVASLITNTAKNFNHTGFSGLGFVDNFNYVGSKMAFSINVPLSGTYNLDIRYSSGQIDTKASLYVNGVKNSQVSYAKTANWDTWGTVTKSVSLNAGVNTVVLQVDSGDTGGLNIDYVELSGTPSTYIRFGNRWPGGYLNTESGLQCTAIQPTWFSAMWTLETTANGYTRIKNRYTGNYLNTESGTLQCTAVQSGWWSADWVMLTDASGYTRFQNRWTGNYINMEAGLQCSSILPVWWSADWTIEAAQ